MAKIHNTDCSDYGVTGAGQWQKGRSLLSYRGQISRVRNLYEAIEMGLRMMKLLLVRECKWRRLVDGILQNKVNLYLAKIIVCLIPQLSQSHKHHNTLI
jgi:hypothetical protein